MSTKTRESCPTKRGTSPSASNGGGGGRSPGPSSKTASPDEKNIPNYLRPTASSSNEAKKPLSTIDKPRRRSLENKPPSPSRSSSFSAKTSSDGAEKPALLRRRSFDKPPSPSRTQKSPVASPKPTLRSSSFSGRTGGVQKGVSERNLKGPKDAGKQHTLYARPVSTGKQSNVLAKKQPVSGSSRKEKVANPPQKVENPNTNDVPEPEPEPQSDDPESSVAENCNVQEVEDSVQVEDQEVTNVVEQSEGESHDKDGSAIESPKVLEQDDANTEMDESHTNSENQDDKNETVEPPSMVLEAEEASGEVNAEEIEDDSRAEEIQEQTTTEKNETDSDERVADISNEEEVKDEKEEEAKAEYGSESHESNETEVAENGSESHECKETEVDVKEKTEDENATPREANGKKDLALSNDVIEETKAKLIEQRKNKVKALAGAFESVISQQDPK